MAKTIKEWLDTDVKKWKRKGVANLSTTYFFRDPTRPNFIDHDLFFTPADGTIMYQKIVEDPTQPIVEIKGINYTLQEVLQDSTYNLPSIVIGIFMSFYDVHINRIPYSGILKYEQADAIQSYNLPMLGVEKSLLKQMVNTEAMMPYIKNNERMINTIYSPSIDYEYYVTQIADDDVDVILPFCLDQNEFYNQNERFSQVRWGSQCELILPLDDRFDFELLQEEGMHVECCYDALVKIHRRTPHSKY